MVCNDIMCIPNFETIVKLAQKLKWEDKHINLRTLLQKVEAAGKCQRLGTNF